MSIIRRPKFGLGWILSASQWAAAHIGPLRELQNILAWSLFDGDPTNGSKSHVTGMQCFGGSASGKTAVSAGFAFRYDSAAYGTAESSFGLHYNGALLEVSHVGAEANPRIDLISISTAKVDDISDVVAQYKSAPQSGVNTQEGSRLTITVTKGVAGASPVPPATPAGQIPLYYVQLPANDDTPANWIYTDNRPASTGAKRRGRFSPMKFTDTPFANTYAMAEFYDTTQYSDRYRGGIWYNTLERLMEIDRPADPNDADEFSGVVVPYPLPSDRREVVTYGIGNGYVDTANKGSGIYLRDNTKISLTEGDAASHSITYHATIPVKKNAKLIDITIFVSGLGTVGAGSGIGAFSLSSKKGAVILFDTIALTSVDDDPSNEYAIPAVNTAKVAANMDVTMNLEVTLTFSAADATGATLSLYGFRATWEHYRSGPLF